MNDLIKKPAWDPLMNPQKTEIEKLLDSEDLQKILTVATKLLEKASEIAQEDVEEAHREFGRDDKETGCREYSKSEQERIDELEENRDLIIKAEKLIEKVGEWW